MGKPRMIILIRHAQSEGNKNRDIHQTIPDHRVKLTEDGWSQAREAGHRLKALLRPTDTLHFFTSPYRRTRETTEGILSTLTSSSSPDSDDSASSTPSPFARENIKVYEEPRLREQDFGNFQPCSAEMERMWQERADYGHFFYRIPNGESAADAYDRVSGFNESLWRQFGEEDFASVCVLVTHGLMSRVFLMKWYHFSVEYFEDLRNVNHCEFLIMQRREDSGKYELQNTLRTWSQLKKDRAAAGALSNISELPKLGDESTTMTEKEREKESKKEESKIPKRKQWGGCPNGCQHGSISRTTSSQAVSNEATANGTSNSSSSASTEQATNTPRKPSKEKTRPQAPIDTQRAQEEDSISSPDQTPSYITLESRNRHHLRTPLVSSRSGDHDRRRILAQGRDFGGSASGHTSQAEDEDGEDTSGEEENGKAYITESGMGRGAMADALGDQSDDDEEGTYDCDNCTKKDGEVKGNQKEGGVAADVY